MRTFLLLLTSLAAASAFSPVGTPSRSRPIRHALRMRFFDALFAPKSASASHILITGPRASEQCEKLKMDIYRKAIGGGDPRAGVSAPALMEAFSQQARAKSTCPSKKQGGSLGTFLPGEMVPEFDAVVFKETVGVVHGPVETKFGSHLVLVTDRK